MRWRLAGDLPPGALLIISPYDPEARCGGKRDLTWLGYKAHLTETCDDDQPHLITHVETTPRLDHRCRDDRGRSRRRWPRTTCSRGRIWSTPATCRASCSSAARLTTAWTWSARCPATIAGRHWPTSGFAFADFAIDWAAGRVTCPARADELRLDARPTIATAMT